MFRTPATEDEARDMLLAAKVEWLGEFGEKIWSNVLAASGWHYVSLAKICEGGAPLARGGNRKLILPDLDAYRDGRNVFVEAKVKTQSIVYRIKNQERHGINQRNYEHYMEIQRVSGRHCCIGLVELFRESRGDGTLSWSGSLLFEKLSDLLDPRSEYDESPRKVYWKRKQFRDLASFTAIELCNLANGKLKLDIGLMLDQILFPAKQKAMF